MTSWTAPAVTRIDEPTTGAERPMLEGWLDWHRQTLLTKAAGLTAEQLKLASAPPSNLTLLGLIRHMTEVERSWFRRRAAGDTEIEYLYCSDDNPDGDFDDVATADAEADLALFQAEAAAVDAAVAGLPLDHEFRHRDRAFSLRWAYVHLVEEYARHCGHADLIRESIDGAVDL